MRRDKSAVRCLPTAEGFEVRNGPRYHNRPLFGADHISMVLAGDRPALMMNRSIHGGKMGNLHIGFAGPGGEKWLHDFRDITALYVPGTMRYDVSDPLLGGSRIALDVAPLPEETGFIARVRGMGLPPGFRIVWMYGGASGYGQMVNAVWEERFLRFTPQDCVDNPIGLEDGYFWLEGRQLRPLQRKDHVADPNPGAKRIFGGTTLAGAYKLCEASGVEHGPRALFERFGVYNVRSTNVPSVVVFQSEPCALSFTEYLIISSADRIPAMRAEPEPVWSSAVEKARGIAHRVSVNTPDIHLDRVVEAMNVASDATWFAPCFNHGNRMWQCPYLGWEIYYGPEVSGWHERVETAIRAFCDKQLPNGAITSNYNLVDDSYNMSEQFLDQIIYHYLWTGDRALLRDIWSVLMRLLHWQRSCNDPDGDGLYTNTLNTWESDYHWYYGGACTQSSAYNWRANQALGEIAEELGFESAGLLQEADRIKRSLFRELWIPSQGRFAEYKDTFGLKRLHEEAEQASFYVPAQSNLTDQLQTYQMLRWLENSLEPIHVHAPGKDGKLYWSSNWRPTPPNGYQHSSRDPAVSVNLNTALAYYRIGAADRAYELLLGAALSCYVNHCPGGISYKAIGPGFENGPAETEDMAARAEGVDLSNTVSLLLRNTVEGLFGVSPEMQKRRITIAPSFPSHWNQASLAIPDVAIEYSATSREDHYVIRSPEPLRKRLRIRARRPGIAAVLLDGREQALEIEPWVEHARICVESREERETELRIRYDGRGLEALGYPPAARLGGSFALATRRAVLLKYADPQAVLSKVELKPHELSGSVVADAGRHMFFLLVRDGSISYWRPVDLDVHRGPEVLVTGFDRERKTIRYSVRSGDRGTVRRRAIRLRSLAGLSPGTNRVSLPGAPQSTLRCWDLYAGRPAARKRFTGLCRPVPMDKLFNLRIADIFSQKYLSPMPESRHWIRPNGLSAWNEKAEADDSLLRAGVADGVVLTDVGVPFRQAASGANAAFVSRWDNFPGRTSVRIGSAARKAYLLICGTTFPMQSHIANGRITAHYTDGGAESLDLVNPHSYDDGLADFGHHHYASDNASQAIGVGTHADIVDLLLDPERTVDSITVEALSNQIVLGLLGITLYPMGSQG